MTTVKKKRLIWLSLVLGLMATVGVMFAGDWRRGTYLRYLSARCDCFRRLGDSVKVYSHQHGGALPPHEEMTATLERLCTSLPSIGIFEGTPESELVFRDLPNGNQDGNLILAAERYSVYDDDLIVLYLDGHVSVSPRPKVTLERDAELRRKAGLPVP